MTAFAYQSRYLDLATVSRLARLRFSPRHVVESSRVGRHASRRQGGAVEFADFKPYAPGEDLRKLDWKVLGRLGRAYVRTFQDETRLSCTLVVDQSGSMRFGAAEDPRASKLEYACHLAASLAFVIAAGDDEVGLALVSSAVDHLLVPGASPAHLARVLELLERAAAPPATSLGAALGSLADRLPQRGVLVLISDFLDDDLEKLAAGIRRFRHRHFEVVCMHVVHPGELALPSVPSCRFVGLEGEGEIVTAPRELAARYQQRFADFLDAVKTLASSTGCDYRRLTTDQGYLKALESFLVSRQG